LKNEENIDTFKQNISKFESKNIQKWIKYLGMDKLYQTMYGCMFLDDKLVIKDIIRITSFGTGGWYIGCKLCDETYFTSYLAPNLNNILVHVSVQSWFDKKGIEIYQQEIKNLKGYLVLSRVGEYNHTFFRSSEIIEKNGMFFVTLSNALKYNIIPSTDNIKNTLKIQ